jgi:hypothetical protein
MLDISLYYNHYVASSLNDRPHIGYLEKYEKWYL